MTTRQKDKILVSIQFLLLGLYLIPAKGFSFPLPAWLSITGFWFGLTGGIPIILAMIALNVNLSPFPTPKKSARLIQQGIFKYVRHPIYSGMLFFVSDSAYTEPIYSRCLFPSSCLHCLFIRRNTRKVFCKKNSVNMTCTRKKQECSYLCFEEK